MPLTPNVSIRSPPLSITPSRPKAICTPVLSSSSVVSRPGSIYNDWPRPRGTAGFTFGPLAALYILVNHVSREVQDQVSALYQEHWAEGDDSLLEALLTAPGLGRLEAHAWWHLFMLEPLQAVLLL